MGCGSVVECPSDMYVSWAQSLAPHTTYKTVLWSYVTVKRQRWSPGVTVIPVYPECSLITAFFYWNCFYESKKCVVGSRVQDQWYSRVTPEDVAQPGHLGLFCIWGKILCNSHWWLWELIQQLLGGHFWCETYRADLLRPPKLHPQECSKTSVVYTYVVYWPDFGMAWT